jgi:RimJ/RimL family protein N-acetyltransferase
VVAVEEEDIAGHFLEPMSLEALQHVYRLTIVVHPGRTGRLYQRLGFVEEGRFRDRIRLPDGTFVDDIAMA